MANNEEILQTGRKVPVYSNANERQPNKGATANERELTQIKILAFIGVD